MVKRWEKMGRKPMLQLDDNKSNLLQPSSSGNLRGLIHYEDSDEDDSSVQGGEEETCVSSAGEAIPNGTKKIDLEVADFLKEIDAMTSMEGQDSSEAEAKDSENHVEVKESSPLNSTEPANSTSNIRESCYWQQCYDETSGYTYFWNTKTNEVTWESPAEYKEYLEKIRLRGSNLNNATNNVEPLYVTNGEASTSSAGRVIPNGLSTVKNSNKPPKKRVHNRQEGKIEPITYFGPPTSDSSDDELSNPKKKKVIENKVTEVHYGPYLPEPISEVTSPVIDVLQSSACVIIETANEEIAVDESSHPTSSSNKTEDDKNERAIDLTRNLVSQSGECEILLPQIQVGNVSDSEMQNGDETLQETQQFSDESVSQPSTSSEGLHQHIFERSTCNSSSITNEDEPDSTCTSRSERHSKLSKISRPASSTLPQGLQFISQYEVTDGESDVENLDPSPLELCTKLSSNRNPQPPEDILESYQVEPSSNSSDSNMAAPSVSSEENSLNNCVSDSEARVVPIRSPENNLLIEQPSASQDEEIDLDEIEKELDRALERKACESSRNVESPTPSQRDIAEEHYQNAQPEPRGNCPENVPTLSQETLELLCNDIIGKLELLTANRAQMPLLSTLLIMVDVRLTDWRNGVLPSQYFMDRLSEANDVLRQYETSAVPQGWTCNWDRAERRYFYTNTESGQNQSEFPTESIDNVTEENNTTNQPHTSITYESILSGKHSSAGQHPVVTSSTAEGLFRSVAKNNKRTVVQSGEASCSYQVPVEPSEPINLGQGPAESSPPVAVDSESPPLPPTPPPVPPPIPPPPDSTEEEDVDIQVAPVGSYEDKGQESYPSSSSSHQLIPDPCPIPSLVSVEMPMVGAVPNPNMPNVVLEQEQMAFYESLGNSWMAQPVVGEVAPAGVIIVRPPLANGIEIPQAYVAPPLQWPILAQPSTDPYYYIPEASGAMNLEANGIALPTNNMEIDEAGPSIADNYVDPLMALPAGPSSAGTSNESPNPTKKDKKKSKLSTGLSLKKKNISSLVEKWQKIKKEQLREEEEVESRKNSDQDGKISTTM